MDFNTCMAEVASLGKFGINLGLQRITELLYRLGEPQKRIPQYLHVTGTNGKGSVSAMCESMLRAGGFFTQNHKRRPAQNNPLSIIFGRLLQKTTIILKK